MDIRINRNDQVNWLNSIMVMTIMSLSELVKCKGFWFSPDMINNDFAALLGI